MKRYHRPIETFWIIRHIPQAQTYATWTDSVLVLEFWCLEICLLFILCFLGFSIPYPSTC